MPRKPPPERDQAIAAALAHTPAQQVAAQYNLSLSSVYRAAGRAEHFAAAAKQVVPHGKPGGASFSQLARTGLRRFGGLIADDYDKVFTSLRKRVELYREMGDDAICAAVLQACKMVIRQASIYAESDGETDADKRAVEFLDQCWDDMAQSGTDTIEQAANMLQYGFYPAELVYKRRQGQRAEAGSKYDDGFIGWRKWTFMAPESLAPGGEWDFDPQGGLQGINQLAPPDYVLTYIPIEKIILFRTTAEKGNPEGRALYRGMYQAWYIKHNLEEIEAISAERMGAGFPVIYLGSDTSRNGMSGDDLDTLKTINQDIRIDEQMSLTIPYAKMGGGAKEGEGVLFELVSPPSKGAVDFGATITRYEQRMAMVGLAQFIHLGMAGVGARALGESSQDFFTLAVSAWADSILDTINRYAVERLFALNYFPGLTAIPRLSHEAVAQSDITKIADYVNKLSGAQVLTPSLELETALLELADLPVTTRLAELWAAKDKAQEDARKRLSQMPATGQQPDNKNSKGAPVAQDQAGANDIQAKAPKEKAMNESDNAALIYELRNATQALLLSQQAEQFSARQSGSPAVTIENRFGDVTLPLPENFQFTQPPAPQVTINVPEPATPQVTVNVPEQAAPMVNVAAPIVNVTPPAMTFNVPELAAPAVNVAAPLLHVDLAPVADAIREVALMPEVSEIQRDEHGLLKSVTKRRRAKDG